MENSKAHFETNIQKRRKNKHQIRKKLTEFNNYLQSIGLVLCSKETIILKKYDGNSAPEDFRMKIIEELPPKNDILNALYVADTCYLSQRTYNKIRTNLNLKDELPSLYKMINLKKSINNLFDLRLNRNGAFLKYPLQKVEFVLKKILNNLTALSENLVIDNKTFIIKLSGDGKVLTKSSRREINNIVFTVINETEKCKTSIGNYILGNFLEKGLFNNFIEYFKFIFTS